MYGRKGIRHASLVYIEVELKGLARGAAEFVCQCSKSRQLHLSADVHDWNPLPTSRSVSLSKGARPAATVLRATLPMKRQPGRAKENFPDPRSIRHSLRTDNFAYIIQVYIIPNTSSHGIMNITWLWIVHLLNMYHTSSIVFHGSNLNTPIRSFSLSRNKKINWKPSSGRSQENEMF